jgi:bisphosphoglycerate-independent phosphoglycerate mutase (AlkP superfamily)
MVADWEIDVIDPEEAGRRVAGLAEDNDLVLFEYVKTDMMGHDGSPEWARDVVDEVMRFLRTVLQRMNSSKDTLLISSDHGNSEDLTVGTHTLNPVPAVAVGPLAEVILSQCNAITDFTPAVLNALKE